MNPSHRPNVDDNSGLSTLIRETSYGAYLLYVGAFVGLVIMGGLAVTWLGHHVGVFVYQAGAILGSALVYRHLAGDDAAPWPRLTGMGVGWKTFVAISVTVVLLGLVGNVTMGLMVEYIPGLEKDAAQYSQRIRRLLLDARGLEWWLGMVSVCVTAPLAEEALFRGTILQEQRKSSLGLWALAFLNGGMFAVFHIQPLIMPSLVLLGSFLAYITLISESLLLPFYAHALVNTVNGLVLPQLIPADSFSTQSAAPTQLWLWFAAFAAASALGWWLIEHFR